jgi:hypothetical protein
MTNYICYFAQKYKDYRGYTQNGISKVKLCCRAVDDVSVMTLVQTTSQPLSLIRGLTSPIYRLTDCLWCPSPGLLTTLALRSAVQAER